jgi:CubicO group peptidase (beta-lactamase class C family)
MPRLYLTILLVLPWIAGSSLGQEPAPKLPAKQITKIDETVKAAMEKGKIVGLAVGIIDNGEVAYVKGYGQADREANVPVSARTMFRWASVSKPITAVWSPNSRIMVPPSRCDTCSIIKAASFIT